MLIYVYFIEQMITDSLMLQEVNRFSGLSSSEKKEKVIALLQYLSPMHTMFATILEKIYTVQEVVDETLVLIYKGVWQVAVSISKQYKERANEQEKAIQKMLQSVHKKEEQEKAEVGDIEKLFTTV